MTNANLEQVVTAIDGQTLTLNIRTEKRKSLSPPRRHRCLRAGDRSDLTPGAKVFIAAIKQPNGASLRERKGLPMCAKRC
jgi:hypothetical protein